MSKDFKHLADEIRKENLMKSIERKHNLHIVDMLLLISVCLLAVCLGLLFVKVLWTL